MHPLEVVLGAPQEVPIDRHAFGCGALQLTEVGAQEHHAVGVIDPAVLGDGVRGPQPFSVIAIDLAPQIDCICFGAQYMTSGSRAYQVNCIFGCEALSGRSW